MTDETIKDIFGSLPIASFYYSDFKPNIEYTVLLHDVLRGEVAYYHKNASYIKFRGKVIKGMTGKNKEYLQEIYFPIASFKRAIHNVEGFQVINSGHWDVLIKFIKRSKKMLEITKLRMIQQGQYNPESVIQNFNSTQENSTQEQ